MCECDLCKYYRKENDYCGYSDMGNGDVRYAPCYRTQYEEGYADGQRDGMKWILVTEALPEEDKDVLVFGVEAISNEYVYGVKRLDVDTWRPRIEPSIRWIAWMPLPEPWRGDR